MRSEEAPVVRVNGEELEEVHPTAIDYALETSPTIHPEQASAAQGGSEEQKIIHRTGDGDALETPSTLHSEKVNGNSLSSCSSRDVTELKFLGLPIA